VFENRVLRRMFGPKRNEGVGENWIMRSFIIYTLVKENGMGWACDTHGEEEE
jgi:hypothetical protein